MTAAPGTLQAALDAAARGWAVFPLRPGTKRPALHGETRCPRAGACAGGHVKWEDRATTDPERITRAWTQAPFNIGLATGPSGLVVIDLDMPK
ncbi:bifunctional DNA primase/polymerase, partial [Streptomyces sp. NPDC047974]|uniref:bifunctional DNA primase/polymerase n=1 Tax=Streptomyces sp. NPDC047974 TaxID=3154343 RepID=UPI00340F4724